ncbi:MAG: M20/M25/M40 family metallo-hydrolase, partial [Actinomycetes bacterium]
MNQVRSSLGRGPRAAGALESLRRATTDMVDCLAALVGCESPSADVEAVARCGDVVADLGQDLLGAPPERVEAAGRTHLRWQFGGAGRIGIIGHFDTVWPIGTLGRWPFAVADGAATGPGAFDMKAGIVQLLYGLSTLETLDGVVVVLTADEEIGSPTSRRLIEASLSDA